MTENERVHFKIALPLDLKRRLEHLSVENRRSLSAEIILRLQESLAIDEMAGTGPKEGYPIYMQEALADKVSAAATRMNRTIEAQALDTLEKAYLPPKP